MKKLFLLTAVLFAAVSSYAQAISQLPLYSGNPAGGLVPVVISGATRKVDASSFGYTKLDTAFLRNDSMFISKYGQTFYVGKFSGATSLNGSGLVKMTGTTPSYITDNSGNWNAAFGWGNHASAGYKTQAAHNIDTTTLGNAYRALINATNTEVALKEDAANKGAANGYAPLNGATKIDPSYLPTGSTTYKGTWNASTNTPTLSDGSGTAGWTYTVSVAGTQNLGSGSITWSVGDQAIHNGTIYQRSPSGSAVTSVAGKTGTVVLNSSDVGLGNADNTSDANKPISTATATALSDKADQSALEDTARDIRAAFPASIDTTPLGNRLTSVINVTNTVVAGKEPTITAGTTGQYWRGDKTWQTLPAAADTTPLGARLTSVINTTNGNVATNTSAIAGKESSLGNPASNGYVLSSTTSGTRSWVPQSSGGSSTALANIYTKDSALNSNRTVTMGAYTMYLAGNKTKFDSIGINTPSKTIDTVFFSGTSITVGTGASSTANRFSTLVANKLGAVEKNVGSSGASMYVYGISAPSLANIPYDFSKYRSLILEWGVNDMNNNIIDTATYAAAYLRYIDTLIARGGSSIVNKTLVLSPSFTTASTTLRQTDFVTATRAVATRRNTQYLDIYSIEVAKGGSILLPDGVHPNDASVSAVYVNPITAKLGDSVRVEGQTSTINGLAEFQKIKIRSTDTANYKTAAIGIDSSGNVVRFEKNDIIRNSYLFPTGQYQSANISLNRGYFGGISSPTATEIIQVNGAIKANYGRFTNTAPAGMVGASVEIGLVSNVGYIFAMDRLTGAGSIGYPLLLNGLGGSKVWIGSGSSSVTNLFQVGGSSNFTGNIYAGGTLAATAKLHLAAGGSVAGSAATKYTAPTTLVTTAASGTGSIVTLTFATQTAIPYPVNSTVRVEGVAPATYNGTFTVTAATTSSVSYGSTATGSQTVAGTVTYSMLAAPEVGAKNEYNNYNWYSTNVTGVSGIDYTTRVLVSSASTLSLSQGYSDYIFSGTTSTWTLPVLLDNKNVVFYIKNRGSGTLTINSNAGGNDLYSTSAVNTISVAAGDKVRLVYDGTFINVE